MASWKILVALAIFALAYPSTMATQWTVGDSAGWALNVSYVEWAAGKTFVVGDKLVFNYKNGTHNVVKVNGTDFQACTVPTGAVPLTSGHDGIVLATPGKHWYICGFPNHCKLGMKLVITVFDELSPVPSPAPSPISGEGISGTFAQLW